MSRTFTVLAAAALLCAAACSRGPDGHAGKAALPGVASGMPMTYAVDGRQFVALSVAGDSGAELVALALPKQ